MIDIAAARKLLDFNARGIGEARAKEQLAGAVAIHNLLERHKVAYLADEVGMGKTYMALGAMALLRHFDSECRVLVIAPRENIQRKWMKELGNFARNNVQFADLRIKSIRGGPARPMVSCESLRDFVHEVSVDSRRDFFLRLSSFSLGLGSDTESWKKERNNLRRELPWLPDDAFDLRSKGRFKENFARAVCCALPVFDLVILDEGHNLRRGYSADRENASRNCVLALAFGHSPHRADSTLFPGYGSRAKRVLILSATPIEDSYKQLWNQLDIFSLGGPFSALKRPDVTDEDKKKIAAQILVRRVTTATVNGTELTKNQYRREWRQGGVHEHDKPIEVANARKRLVVALVQKKVAELLGSGKFNMSFQIGMLASFESFLQTAKVQREDEVVFDDEEQKRDLTEVQKQGVDVRDINKLGREYFKAFGHHMPHPKMDAVVQSLATSWLTGKKTLVFVRRVASVKELKQKLDECYDAWLIKHLEERLPKEVLSQFGGAVARYKIEKQRDIAERQAKWEAGDAAGNEHDTGGTETFFAWFFRGDGPKGIVSGANIQRRFIQNGSVYSTFFERNHVAEVLAIEPGRVVETLATVLGLGQSELSRLIRLRAAKFLSARAKKFPRLDQFLAAQATALELIAEGTSASAERARQVFQEMYRAATKKPHATEAPDVAGWLEERTFFTELLTPTWLGLRDIIWPVSQAKDAIPRFREEELRAQLLSTAARLGHGLIDIYVTTIVRLGSLEPRTLDSVDDADAGASNRHITDYLKVLEAQRTAIETNRPWGAFDELREVATNFDLVLDVNAPEARERPIRETARLFGTLLGRQQPVGGMFGQVNRTLVQQFRMPGYPFVLVTTDLLQEGEDLHTFCSSIHHYGISWTPSSMEQRIGRIDRVKSQTDRRLSNLARDAAGDELLQVHFPHLQDTVEILQVERVLERMNVFLRLMHEGLVTAGIEDKHIDVGKTLARGRQPVERITEKLKTAFPIPVGATRGDVVDLEVERDLGLEVIARLNAVRSGLETRLSISWEHSECVAQLLGTLTLSNGRIQPFTLLIDSVSGRILVRCISPVGVVNLDEDRDAIEETLGAARVRLGAVLDREDRSYNLTVQEDVLLADPVHDVARVEAMLRRTLEQADRIEMIHLPEADRTMDVFVHNLQQEGAVERD